MHEVRQKIRHASYLSNYLSACWVFDLVTPEWIGDIARSLLVLSATINIWGGAQSIKGFATLKNVVHLQFASEVRPRKLFEISLRKSRLHKLHAFMEKRLGTEICCITIRVITGDYCSKSDSKGEDRGSGTVVVLRVDEKIRKAIDCQQEEAKRNYLGFVTVVISIIIIVLLWVLFGRVGVHTCFCIACYCF